MNIDQTMLNFGLKLFFSFKFTESESPCDNDDNDGDLDDNARRWREMATKTEGYDTRAGKQ